METKPIIEGLRAMGVEDKAICDFILYLYTGLTKHYDQLVAYGKSKEKADEESK